MNIYTIDIKNETQWMFLLEYFGSKAAKTVFNINYKTQKTNQFLEEYNEEFIGQFKEDKFYESLGSFQFVLSNRLYKFIKSRSKNSWKTFHLIDISFLIREVEIFASISHEDLALIKIEPGEIQNFIKMDFLLHDVNIE